MSLLWFDGFEQYGANVTFPPPLPLEGVWLDFNQSIVASLPRTGSYCMASGPTGDGFARRSLLGDHSTVGIGCGFYMNAAPIAVDRAIVGGVHRTVVAQFMDISLNVMAVLTVGTTGRLQLFSGDDTKYGESVLEISAGTWNHIETKIKFDNADGTVDVYVNGKSWISATGLDTIPAGVADTCSQVGFGVPGGSSGIWNEPLRWDDIFVYNQDTGGVHDILGQYGVYQLKPNADDATNHAWQLTSGSHGYALINEVPPDDDLDFIFSGIVNDRSDFGVEPLPANIITVAAVMPCGRLRKTDTGAADVELGVNSSGDVSFSADTPITTSWTYYQPLVLETDPHTSAAWAPAAVNASLLAVKRTV